MDAILLLLLMQMHVSIALSLWGDVIVLMIILAFL